MSRKKIVVASLCLFTMGWLGNIESQAGVSPEKVKLYAQIYPDFFEVDTHPIHYKGQAPKKETVSVLINSFDGDATFEEMAAVLRPGDMPTRSMKSEATLRKMAANNGLAWEEVEEMTQSLQSDPDAFSLFMQQVDKSRLQRDVLPLARSKPGFVQSIASWQHQGLFKKVMQVLSR